MNSPQNIRTGLATEEIQQAFRDNLRCGMGRLEATATKHGAFDQSLHFDLEVDSPDLQDGALWRVSRAWSACATAMGLT
jgi:hypothetical protein